MLEKMLKEIESALEENIVNIEDEDGTHHFVIDSFTAQFLVKKIIREHMNDGWIPVEVAPPPIAQRLQATIKHHKWIADYDSDWVPEEEKTIHPEWTEVCEIVSIGAMWFYYCEETDYEKEIAYIGPLKDLSMPVSEIIAWRPIPEPYCPEKAEE